jgi:photosystem II stability/assembly factor-like uncharacterized protein
VQRPEPTTVSFWNGRRGLTGSGDIEGGRLGGEILLTTNGGRTFHRVFREDHADVYLVETAGTEDAWAYVKVPHHFRPRLLHSSNGGRSWHRMGHNQSWGASFATPELGFAAMGAEQGSTAFSEHPGLLASTDGGRTWTQVKDPCRKHESTGVSYPSPDKVWVGCEGDEAVGTAPKAIYESTDRGQSWALRSDCGLRSPNCGHSGLTQLGYMVNISFSASGFGFLSGDNSQLTHNGGLNWTTARPVRDALSASMLSAKRGFTLLRSRLMRTDDAGRSWTEVHRWR